MITLVSTSKTFNLAALHAATGIVVNPQLRQRFVRAVNKYEVAEPNLLSIPGTIAAYTQGGEWLHQLKEVVRVNFRKLDQMLATRFLQVKRVPGRATYLAWLDVSAISSDGDDFANFLAQEVGLIVNAGSHYQGNGQGFIRLNLAYPTTVVEDGINRLAKGLEMYQA